MIRSLRKKPKHDDLVAGRRRATNSKGRMVYVALLIIFALAVLDLLFGDFLFLRADGLVVRDRTSIEATYLSRVEELNAKEGQSVARGMKLLRLQSPQMLERLADLSARNADLAAKVTEFRVRAETAASLLPLAAKRESKTKQVVAEFERLSKTGNLTNTSYDKALQTNFKAREAMVRLKVGENALKQELTALDAARRDASAALSDLRKHYSDGTLLSPVDGSIGSVVPSVGDVYQPGESILSIYSGKAYVLAYLPRRYLFPIHEGMEVRVSSGRTSAVGVVSSILPVTRALPSEFQNTFRPQDRNQLARITLREDKKFPLHEKVAVRRNMFGFLTGDWLVNRKISGFFAGS